MKTRLLLLGALWVVWSLRGVSTVYGQAAPAKTVNDEYDPCNDMSPPSISCPGTFCVSTDPGVCTAVATFSAPTASDDCTDSPTVTCSPASGSTFEKGQTTVTCTATDNAGKSSTCSFIVCVHDQEAPVFTWCPPSITQQIPPGECSAEVLYSDPEATDNCGTPTITCTPPSGSTFPSGKTTVTCTATDEDGNSTSSCSFVVTVDDQVPPMFTWCPPSVTQPTDPGRCDAVSFLSDPTATDNCPGTPTITCSPPSGSTFPKGTTVVTCTATDGGGNSTSDCTFTVTVEDQEPPMMNCPGNMSVATDAGVCNAVVNYPMPTPSDNCPDVGMVTCDPAPGSTFDQGVTPVTCTVSDASGNMTMCSFTITVSDIERPSITCPANISQNTDPGLCSAVVNFGFPEANDNCEIASIVCSPPPGSTFLKGTTAVVCTASDTSGNTRSCSFAVIVKDMELPNITCPPNRTKNTDPNKCNAVVTFATPTVSDNCPGVTVTCSPPSGSTFNKGVTTITCTAKDDSGNMKSCTLTVTVNDKQKPSLACPGDITNDSDPGLCTAVVTFGTPTATDNCPGPISPVTCVPASGSAFITGLTTVICTATDASGNVGACFFTVTVVDAQLPVVTCPGSFGKATDPGLCTAVVTFAATATDNCPDVSPVVCAPASGSTFARGNTVVTCTATDSSGNSGNCSFTVTVSDNEKPVITCPAGFAGSTDPGVCTRVVTFSPTATDNCGTPTVTCVPASGSAFARGFTTVTCTATDGSANSSSCAFSVTVLDTEKPVITCPGNMAVPAAAGQCSATPTFSVTATDNCTGTPTPTCVPASGSTFPKGATVVVCTAIDTSGNASTCSFTVTVADLQPPVINCPGNISLDTAPGQCSAPATFSATATDNCPGLPTPTCVPGPGSSFSKGVTTVTCTVTDTSGNSSSCSFTVTVSDKQKPVITCPPHDIMKCADPSGHAVVTWPTPSASDNCGAPTVTCAPASGSTFSVGTSPVTCTATDSSGNSASCSFNVKVVTDSATTYTCAQSGSVNNAGTLSQTTFTVGCAGGSITPPTASGTTFNNGIKNTIVLDCTTGVTTTTPSPVTYTPGGVYFVPPIPATFTTPGVFTFTAYVDGIPSDAVCPVVTATVGTITVTVGGGVSILPGIPGWLCKDELQTYTAVVPPGSVVTWYRWDVQNSSGGINVTQGASISSITKVAGDSGHFSITLTVTFAGGSQCSATYIQDVKKLSPIEYKRHDEPDHFFSTTGGGSVVLDEVFDFRTTIVPAGAPTARVTWDVWDLDGFDEILGSGPGAQFSFTMSDPDSTRVRFWCDKDGNLQFDSSEHHVETEFEVKSLKINMFKVVRHVDVPYSDAQADAMLAGATSILRTRNQVDDVRCAVVLQRDGPVTTFGVTGSPAGTPPAIINTGADMSLVQGVTGHYKVVLSINWCGGPGGANGCTLLGEKKTAIISSAGLTTWAHEFGHQKSLPDLSGPAHRVMFGTGNPAKNTVGESEHSSFEQ